MWIKGKRELIARALVATGWSRLLRHLPPSDGLLVLSYHRIGSPDQDKFDPGLFSATSAELDDQIYHLKRIGEIVTLQEAGAFLQGREDSSRSRCRILLTFDDGYRDSYDVAFPIVQSHGVQAVFFLATSLIGSDTVPWWDRIAFMVKNSRTRRFGIDYPTVLDIDIDRDGLEASLRAVLRSWKQETNLDRDRFLKELASATGVLELPRSERRFLNWAEAKEMIDGGMAIGSHTCSHTVLSQLTPDQQKDELFHSRMLLQQHLGVEVEALAYPVGRATSFSASTIQYAREAGYKMAFSKNGGSNIIGKTSLFDIKRHAADAKGRPRFQLQANMYRTFGHYWP